MNFTLLLYSSLIYGLTKLCYGNLRAVEVEQLTERAWFAITETCLAMTIFREEIGAWFLVMFTALLTGRVWGWIGDGRVEFLEQQPPANPRLFHLRLSVSLAISFIYDIWILKYTVNTVIQKARPNMMVMFLFEFAVLATCSWRTGVRYILSIVEQNIIRAQTSKRLSERRQEVRARREAMIRDRERAAAEGRETQNQEPVPNEEDIDEIDIEVPGWAAKGEWILWLDLVTGQFEILHAECKILSLSNVPFRHDQARHLYCIFLHAAKVLWITNPHHERPVHDFQRLHQAAQCPLTLSSRHSRNEQIS